VRSDSTTNSTGTKSGSGKSVGRQKISSDSAHTAFSASSQKNDKKQKMTISLQTLIEISNTLHILFGIGIIAVSLLIAFSIDHPESKINILKPAVPFLIGIVSYAIVFAQIGSGPSKHLFKTFALNPPLLKLNAICLLFFLTGLSEFMAFRDKKNKIWKYVSSISLILMAMAFVAYGNSLNSDKSLKILNWIIAGLLIAGSLTLILSDILKSRVGKIIAVSILMISAIQMITYREAKENFSIDLGVDSTRSVTFKKNLIKNTPEPKSQK
jgi:hypothetical protein